MRLEHCFLHNYFEPVYSYMKTQTPLRRVSDVALKPGLAPAPCTLVNVLAASYWTVFIGKKSVLSNKWYLPSKNMLSFIIGMMS